MAAKARSEVRSAAEPVPHWLTGVTTNISTLIGADACRVFPDESTSLMCNLCPTLQSRHLVIQSSARGSCQEQ